MAREGSTHSAPECSLLCETHDSKDISSRTPLQLSAQTYNSLTMETRPDYRRTPSTNLGSTASYRPHEGKLGIVTGGSRGTYF